MMEKLLVERIGALVANAKDFDLELRREADYVGSCQDPYYPADNDPSYLDPIAFFSWLAEHSERIQQFRTRSWDCLLGAAARVVAGQPVRGLDGWQREPPDSSKLREAVASARGAVENALSDLLGEPADDRATAIAIGFAALEQGMRRPDDSEKRWLSLISGVAVAGAGVDIRDAIRISQNQHLKRDALRRLIKQDCAELRDYSSYHAVLSLAHRVWSDADLRMDAKDELEAFLERGLKQHPHAVKLERERALVCGLQESQYALFDKYRDSETMSAIGKHYKVLAQKEWETDAPAAKRHYAVSSEWYAKGAYNLAGKLDHYPLVNAASTAFLAGKAEETGRFARQALEAIECVEAGAAPDKNAEETMWRGFSKAEARLLAGDGEAARKVYAAVLGTLPPGDGAAQIAYDQICRLYPELDARVAGPIVELFHKHGCKQGPCGDCRRTSLEAMLIKFRTVELRDDNGRGELVKHCYHPDLHGNEVGDLLFNAVAAFLRHEPAKLKAMLGIEAPPWSNGTQMVECFKTMAFGLTEPKGLTVYAALLIAWGTFRELFQNLDDSMFVRAARQVELEHCKEGALVIGKQAWSGEEAASPGVSLRDSILAFQLMLYNLFRSDTSDGTCLLEDVHRESDKLDFCLRMDAAALCDTLQALRVRLSSTFRADGGQVKDVERHFTSRSIFAFEQARGNWTNRPNLHQLERLWRFLVLPDAKDRLVIRFQAPFAHGDRDSDSGKSQQHTAPRSTPASPETLHSPCVLLIDESDKEKSTEEALVSRGATVVWISASGGLEDAQGSEWKGPAPVLCLAHVTNWPAKRDWCARHLEATPRAFYSAGAEGDSQPLTPEENRCKIHRSVSAESPVRADELDELLAWAHAIQAGQTPVAPRCFTAPTEPMLSEALAILCHGYLLQHAQEPCVKEALDRTGWSDVKERGRLADLAASSGVHTNAKAWWTDALGFGLQKRLAREWGTRSPLQMTLELCEVLEGGVELRPALVAAAYLEIAQYLETFSSEVSP